MTGGSLTVLKFLCVLRGNVVIQESSLKYSLSPGHQYRRNPTDGKSHSSDSLFPFPGNQKRASLFGRKSYIFFIVLQGCFLHSQRLFKHTVLMCASKLPLESIPPPLCFSSNMGLCNAHSLSLRECALHCWFFLIFIKWGKLYHSSGRSERALTRNSCSVCDLPMQEYWKRW